jgi:phage terminase large subunit GpA-like protein
MPEHHLSPVARAAMAAWKPQDNRQPWEWAEENYVVPNTSPFPGPWRSMNSPWVKEVMEVASNKLVSFLAVKCSAQSSKTETLLAMLCWTICEDPGPTLWLVANQDDAQDLVRDRFTPSMELCKPAMALLLRPTKLNFTFRTMPLYFVGAGSMAKLQGKPMKRLFLDEVRNYPPGALETVMKRVRAFGQLAQVFIISTPGNKDDSVDLAFRRGDQRTFHFPCPKCGTMQQLRMEQLKAEHPKTRLCVKWEDVPGAKDKESGQWNFEVLGRAVRYQCFNPSCGHLIADTPTERKWICRRGTFIRMNPKAEPGDVSFTWNALLPWWVPWRDIVKEYLLALQAARAGNVEPLKTFVTETLGESWEDRLGVVEDFGFLEARKANYDYGEPWAEEQRRFMSADRQESGGENYWWVVRAFGPHGKSRLVAHGNCKTKVELEEIRKEYNVAKSDAMIDSGYETQDVYRFAGANGWKVFKGDHVRFYLVTKASPQNPKQSVTVRQIWRRTNAVVYNAQTRMRIGSIPLYTFAGDPTSDLLAEYMAGLVGDWTMPQQVEREYLKQMTGDRRQEHRDPKTSALSYFWKTVSDNHYRDCERMILIAAIINRIVNAPASPPKQEKAPVQP